MNRNKACTENRASLVVQWLRICLVMQGTSVPSRVQDDPTCRTYRAAKPLYHSEGASILEPMSQSYRAQALQLLKPACLEPMLQNKGSHHHKEKPTHCKKCSPGLLQLEKAHVQQ